MGGKAALGVEVSAFYASLTVLSLRCPALLLRTVGVTWEHTNEKWFFFASHKRKHIHFNNKRSVVFCHLSILRIIYTSRALVFFFLLHQFGDDCETQ